MSENPIDRDILAKALSEIRRLKEENQALKEGALRARSGGGVAIVGMACRFPGGLQTPEAYWQFLRDGNTAVERVPGYRWNLEEVYDDSGTSPGKVSCPYGSFIGPVDLFDCRRFGISPMEARWMDPHQRLLLELVWKALEQAKIRPSDLKGSRTGVFVGHSSFDFALQHLSCAMRHRIEPYLGSGAAFSPLAGRISHVFDLRGPSFVMDTACSSSLVAMHNACISLERGESELALVGASNLVLDPAMSINFDKAGLLARDGEVRSFDDRAHGYVRSEGAGVLVLKNLEAARRDGDAIHAVIMGSAINEDGASNGLMSPSGKAQQEVYRLALERAGIGPEEVGLVEAHGTATPLGDQVELESLSGVYGSVARKTPLVLGSHKANFGHMEAAAGMGGVFKLIMALKEKTFAPQIHFKRFGEDQDVSPHIRIPMKSEPWDGQEGPRRAAISSFGFSGTNVHLILEEDNSTRQVPEKNKSEDQLLVWSAGSLDSVLAHTREVVGELEDVEDLAPASQLLCHHREGMPQRLSWVGQGGAALKVAWQKFEQRGRGGGFHSGKARGNRPKTAFVFPGHGCQYPGMGAGLYQLGGAYRERMDEMLGFCASELDLDLKPLLTIQHENNREGGVFEGRERGLLDETRYAQVAISCVQMALTRQWEDWGFTPSYVLGHSLGEYSAAHAAGVMHWKDVLRLVSSRARWMEEETPEAGMICVFADLEALESLISEHEDLHLAAENGPGIVLLSGTPSALALARKTLGERGLRWSEVPITRAFHSPMAQGIVPKVRALLENLDLNTPRVPLISNITGKEVGEEIARPKYWLDHLCQPVQFSLGMQTLHTSNCDLFVELGPDPVLMGLDLCYKEVRLKTGSHAVWVPTLAKGKNDRTRILDALGRMFVAGYDLGGVKLPGDGVLERRDLADLPTTPFDGVDCRAATSDTPVEPSGECSPRAEVLPPLPGTRKDLQTVMAEHLELMQLYLERCRDEEMA